MLVATAFLLVRGPFERVLASPIWSGMIFGVLGASEAVFPTERFPYASHTLACAFATAFVSWRAGAVTAIVSIAAAIALRPAGVTLATAIQATIIVLIVSFSPRPTSKRILIPAMAVALAQGLAILAIRPFGALQASLLSPWTIPANTFGVVLLWVVIRDAQVRSDAERHRQETVEARRLAAEAQLVSLRARVQPHFLYNALGSIAALCAIAPDRASKAVIRLGTLMRQALEADFSRPHTLSREIETVKGYVEIEQERFGPKLEVEYSIEGCEDVPVPAFGVQLLVENAILHGVSRSVHGGQVSVLARRRKRYALVVVADNGVGLPAEGWRRDTPHGLGILEGQILAQAGIRGRLRLARRPSGGTLAVMRIPEDDAEER